MKKSWWDIGEFMFGFVLLGILLWKIGLKEVYVSITSIHTGFLVAAFCVLVLVLVIGGVNVWLLSKALGYKGTSWLIVQSYILNWIVAQTMPIRMSSISFIVLLKKAKIKVKDGIAMTFVDKIVTFVILFIFLMVAVGYFLQWEKTIVYFVMLTGVIIVLSVITFSTRIEVLIVRVLDRWNIRKVAGFTASAKRIVRQKRVVFLNALVTIAKMVLTAGIPYIIYLGFAVEAPDIVGFFLVTVMITVLASIPITAAGLGVREVGAAALFATLMHLNPVIVTSTYILFLFLKYSFAILFLGSTLLRKVLSAV